MDAEVAQMMADLSSSRRDALSAPGEEVRGRVMREDISQQAAVMAKVEARRQNLLKGGDTVVSKWHDVANFSADAAAEDLVNRFSGQGHRAALAARRSGRRGPALQEGRLGEERMLYLRRRPLQQMNTDTINRNEDWLKGMSTNMLPPQAGSSFTSMQRSRHAVPLQTHAKAPANEIQANLIANVWKSSQRTRGKSEIKRATDTLASVPRQKENAKPKPRSKPPSSRPPARTLAFGDVPSGWQIATQRMMLEDNSRPVQNPVHKSTAPSNGTANAVPTEPESEQGQDANELSKMPSKPSNQYDAKKSALSNMTRTVDSMSDQKSAAAVQVADLTGQKRASAPHKRGTSTVSPLAAEKLMALRYAANPSPTRADYYTKHPEHRHLLVEAREQLAREAVALTAQASSQAFQQYKQDHPDRAWMLDVAIDARRDVNTLPFSKINEKYLKSNDHKYIYLFAKEALDREARDQAAELQESAVGPSTTSALDKPSLARPLSQVSGSSSSESSAEDSSVSSASSDPAAGKVVASVYTPTGELASNHKFALHAPVQVDIGIRADTSQLSTGSLLDAINMFVSTLESKARELSAINDDINGMWDPEEENLIALEALYD